MLKSQIPCPEMLAASQELPVEAPLGKDLNKTQLHLRPGGIMNTQESVIVSRMFLEKMPHTGQVKRNGKSPELQFSTSYFHFSMLFSFSLIFLFFIYLVSYLFFYNFGSLLSRKHLAAHNIWSPPGSSLQLPGDP